jgi:hypothetical protein
MDDMVSRTPMFGTTGATKLQVLRTPLNASTRAVDSVSPRTLAFRATRTLGLQVPRTHVFASTRATEHWRSGARDLRLIRYYVISAFGLVDVVRDRRAVFPGFPGVFERARGVRRAGQGRGVAHIAARPCRSTRRRSGYERPRIRRPIGTSTSRVHRVGALRGPGRARAPAVLQQGRNGAGDALPAAGSSAAAASGGASTIGSAAAGNRQASDRPSSSARKHRASARSIPGARRRRGRGAGVIRVLIIMHRDGHQYGRSVTVAWVARSAAHRRRRRTPPIGGCCAGAPVDTTGGTQLGAGGW